MVNTPLLAMFQMTSMMANNNAVGHAQTVDLASAKLNDLYSGGGGGRNAPRLGGRRSSAGPWRAMRTIPTPAPLPSPMARQTTCWWLFDESCAMVAAILDLVFGVPLSNTSDCFCGSDDGSNVMAAAHQHAPLAGIVIGISGFNLGLGSPALAEVPNGLSLAQLVQLDGIDGMNSV
ncbi:hypothetical protein EDB84DRAFT_1673152 [Lactarius hengduanensis]|nr:hypothetical protein EDB84DRAFT_1673152 [Lactarius hengduanensis]